MICLDDALSAEFQRQKRDLAKKYRRIDSDIATAFEDIVKDFTRVCNAVPIPGYDKKVWKYRIRNSDNNKGSSAGYRLLVYYHDSTATLYPFSIYTHDKYPAQPPKDKIDLWMKESFLSIMRRPATKQEP